ncbi:MAG: alpha/beta fold hydrolase [Nevskiales bacterium]
MEHFVTTDGVRLAYRVDDFTDPWRKPDTILLLHPAMSSTRRMFGWVPHLARRLRVVRMDLRGHGESAIPPPDSEISMDRLSRDGVELLDHLGVQRAHLVGISAGGFIAQYFAATFGDRLHSLALVASTPDPRRTSMKSWLPRIAGHGLRTFLTETISARFDTARVDPGLIAWFLDEMDRNDAPFISRFISAMAEVDLTDKLARIACPTLLLMPGNASLLPPEALPLMQARIRDHELILYQGFNHQIGDAAADRCAQDVCRFIDRRFRLPPLLGL